LNKYRPERSLYQFVSQNINSTDNDASIYNFDTNSKYYAKLSETFKDPWNFINIYLIHYSIESIRKYQTPPKKKEMKDFISCVNQEINREKSNNKRENNYLLVERDNQIKQNGKNLFSKNISHYSLVVEYFKDEHNDIIIRLRFPGILNFYNIPINSCLNISKLFGNKWNKSKIDDKRVHLKLKIDLSDNSTNDKSKYSCEIKSSEWKTLLPKEEFIYFYNRNEFVDDTCDNDKFEELRNNLTIQNRSIVEQNKFTLNSILTLEFNLEFNTLNKGHVLVVQVNPEHEFKTDQNKFKNKDFENYLKKNSNAKDPYDKPHVELIRFNKLIHYCFVHHAKAIKQDYIWLIRNVSIAKFAEHFIAKIKVSDFTQKYWLKNDKKPNKICLSCVDSLYETDGKLDTNELIHADNEYVSIYHGSIRNFDDMIVVYEKNKEILELELILEIYGFKLNPQIFENKKFTLEFYYEDNHEELNENGTITL
jgi:hypothetical protein